MTFDDLQKTWQSQPDKFRLNIDSDLLLREVKRNKESFQSTIFWRDVREVGAAFAVAIFFVYLGVKSNSWSLYFPAAGSIFVGVFMIIDRINQKKRSPKSIDPLLSCVEISLTQIEHQIWLLKNVFWWYMLPIIIGVAIFTTDVGWKLYSLSSKDMIFHFVRSFIIWFLLGCGIYYLNQYAVRKGLSPRKEELEQLLSSLKKTD